MIRNHPAAIGRLALVAGALAIALHATPSFAEAAPAEAGAAAGDPWASVDSAPAFGEDDQRIIGRVAGIRGVVYAQTPGESRRRLTENAPIYPGDRIITSRGAQIGVLSGEYYTGLNEDSTLVYEKRGANAPEVRLERGDVRTINAGDGENARIETPGMVARAGAADTKAYAVQEKAWMVSVVCALEGQVTVADGSGDSLVVEEGGCAASKPVEGIFAAGPIHASDTPITYEVAGPGNAAAKSDDGPPPAPPSGDAANRFPTPDVGAPGTFSAFAAHPPIRASVDPLSILQPCDNPASGCSSSAPGAAGGPTAFVALPPWVGGVLPP